MIRLAATFGLALAAPGLAQTPPEPPKPDPAYDRYAVPATRVAIARGRAINLDCRGTGGPTVLLFPGLTAWSEAWVKVHDRLAQRRRVCAFDPAGFGFSDASPLPQDTTHIVADVEATLKAARIAGPYVVVGHSAGGLQALTFADRHRRDTVGMVLVDPTFPGIFARFRSVAPTMSRIFAAQNVAQKAIFARCAQTLARGPMTPKHPEAEGCFLYSPGYTDKLRTALADAETAPRMRTKITQLESFGPGASYAVNPRRNYGAMPLIVLTRGQMGTPSGTPATALPPAVATEGPAMDQAWVAAHAALARLSTRGQHRTVPGAGHLIQLDRPEAVITAIEEVAGPPPR